MLKFSFSSVLLLFIFSSIIYSQPGSAQDLFSIDPADSIYVEIETTKGNVFSGLVVNVQPKFIELEAETGLITKIPRLNILSYEIIKEQEAATKGYFFSNPHATRYFYGPNGYGLRNGEGYYQNLWVMFNQVSYGFSDYFSLGTGMIPLFFFQGAPTPVWVTPKVSIPLKKDRVNLGAGVLAATILGENFSLGIAYGVITMGSRDKNTSLGVGWAYTSDGFADYPTINLGAMYRVGPKGYILTENYLITGAYETIGIISAGGRTVQKKLAVDYGLFIPVNIGVTAVFPWLSITLPFGEPQ